MAEKRAETGYPGLGDARRGRHGVAIVVVYFVVEGQRVPVDKAGPGDCARWRRGINRIAMERREKLQVL